MKIHKSVMKNSAFIAIGFIMVFGFTFISCDDSSPSGPNVDNTNYSASEDFSYRIAIGNKTSLRVEAINGSVEVEGASNIDSVRIWGERKVESESVADAEAHLPELSVEINEHDGQIIVWTDQPEQSYGRNYQVEYNIQVPEDWQLDIEEVNGNINISDMEQSVVAGLTNGNLYLWDISGSVDGELINGNIDSKIVLPAAGVCELSIMNGQIDLMIPQSTSASFSASVMNGEIDLANISLQNQTITSTSIFGTLGSGNGEVDLSTMNGNIHVTGF